MFNVILADNINRVKTRIMDVDKTIKFFRCIASLNLLVFSITLTDFERLDFVLLQYDLHHLCRSSTIILIITGIRKFVNLQI